MSGLTNWRDIDARDEETGMPAHLPMAVDEERCGPVPDEEAHSWVCWCWDEGCPVMTALRLADQAAARRVTENVMHWHGDTVGRLERAIGRLEENAAAKRQYESERFRLGGKVEGVKLALSFLREVKGYIDTDEETDGGR